MKRKVFAIALVLMLLVPVFMAVATEFKNYRWAKFHLKFKLPEHWNVTTNTATESSPGQQYRPQDRALQEQPRTAPTGSPCTDTGPTL
jgi:hypothetical protein